MKTNTILLCVIVFTLISGMLISRNSRQTEIYRNLEQVDVKEHTMTIEEIDAECRLYRIDITSPEELEDRPYIDYNIKVKFQTVALSNLDRDSIINMIREECPENITSITVRF